MKIKAQGAIEYLLLIAGAVIVAAVVLSVLRSTTGETRELTNSGLNTATGQIEELTKMIGHKYVVLAGSGACPTNESALTKNNPWSNVYFYDNGDNAWNNSDDCIWQENGGDGVYNSGTDTDLAGSCTDGSKGTTSNPWSNVYFYDNGDNAWNNSDDLILLQNDSATSPACDYSR